MKLTYLIAELEKLGSIMDQQTDAFLESIESSPQKRKYIRNKLMPVTSGDYDHQINVVANEAERLLKEKYERCTNEAEK